MKSNDVIKYYTVNKSNVLCLKILRLSIVFTLTLTLFSCADLKKGQQIETIVALEKSIDSINTVLIENKLEQIDPIIRQSRTIERRILDKFNPDSIIDLETGKKLDQFKEMLTTFDPLHKAYSDLKKYSKKESIALKELKSDIENSNGDRAKYDEYVSFEIKKVDQLRQLLSDYVQTKNKSVKTFNAIHEDVNTFSLKLIHY